MKETLVNAVMIVAGAYFGAEFSNYSNDKDIWREIRTLQSETTEKFGKLDEHVGLLLTDDANTLRKFDSVDDLLSMMRAEITILNEQVEELKKRRKKK